MIEVQHLTKRYGRVTAVDDLTFKVERGEILAGAERGRQDDDDGILTGYMPASEQGHGRRSTSSPIRSKPNAAPVTCRKRRRSIRK
jgi:hypothetical protein